MARKRHSHKKKSPVLEYRRLPLDDLHRRIEEYRSNGNLRAAIDIAKECHRRQQTPAHTERLVALYVERGRQLIGKNLHTEALMVLTNALSLGHGSVELLRLVFECGLRSGQYDSAVASYRRLQDPAERQQAALLLADEAIARGDAGGPLAQFCEPPLREDVARIRQAFAAFEQGDDHTVAAELKPVGLRSPCARWKWLLLGLAAYDRGDLDNARAGWTRAAGPGRVGRLAELLRSVLAPDPGTAPAVPPQVAGRVLGCFGNPRVGLLQKIKQALDNDEPEQAMDLCGKLLAGIDPNERPAYSLRLARAVCLPVADDVTLTKRFRRVFGALPEDPHLVRAAAVDWEREDPREAIHFWQLHLDYLKQMNTVPQRLYPRARAMIWQRMGDLERGIEARYSPPLPWLQRRTVLCDQAVRCYETSIQLYDDDQRTHEKLLDTLVAGEAWRRAEKQAERILQRWPTHANSLLFLGSRCLERDALRKALGYFERARQAQPFDNEIRRRIETCFLLSARRRLDKGNLDLARQDYERAEQYSDPESVAALYGKWAALEYRAGNGETAEGLMERARASGRSPLSLAFLMTVETQRAKAPADVCDRFETRLIEALRQPPTALDAAEAAGLANELRTTRVDYPGRDAHGRALLRYLHRAADAQIAFTEDELLTVCSCVESANDWPLLEKLSNCGAQLFPGNYLFVMQLGRAELRQGRRRVSKSTRKLLDQADQRAQKEDRIDIGAQIALLRRGILPPDGNDPMRLLGTLLLESLPFSADMDLDDSGDGDDDFELDLPASPPRPPRKRKRRTATNQLPLFDDLFEPEPEMR